MPLPDPSQPLDVVLVDDQRLADDMDKLAYLRTRDPALIRDKSEQARAIRFRLVPLPRRYKLRISHTTTNETQRWYLAGMACIRNVCLPDGTDKPAAGLQTLADSPRTGEVWQCAGEEWEDYLLSILSDDQLHALGRIAWERAGMPREGLLPLR